MSETPVTLVPEASQLGVRCAPTGSVTVLKTIGMLLVAATSAWADGVAMPTITSGLSPMNLRAICAAVPVLPWALWYCPEVLAVFVAGLLEGLLDPVASGVQRRVLDDGGHGHRLLLFGVGAEGQGHAKGQGTEGQPFILIGLHHAAIS